MTYQEFLEVAELVETYKSYKVFRYNGEIVYIYLNNGFSMTYRGNVNICDLKNYSTF